MPGMSGGSARPGKSATRPTSKSAMPYAIAVLLPCYNEALAIARVVADFSRALPSASIYVYDNNSSDDTATVAAAAGATVLGEARQGKGHVVRRMFADIEADIYVLADGDGTYDAAAAPRLVSRLIEGRLDFVNGARHETRGEAFRHGHKFGNSVLSGLVQWIFGRDFADMLSGYKVFSRRFVKSFPAMSRGFEIETELTVHALELRMPSAEIATRYGERQEGSASKLRTLRDGVRILSLIGKLVKDERPLMFYGGLASLFVASAVILGIPIVAGFMETGLVPRLPTAVLCTGLVILGVLSLFTGVTLDLVTKTRQELKRLIYLSIPIRF
ncbi:Glycosyltransferase involved in cell wall bisynthesis [Rhizobiales bacterium GAS188]|nr:Glycosyltransferase involved in cell wall bisynthesis [Rhizobiales bacterium GAS188]